ncbi:dihydrofolate reductase [Candidatus Gracilibacteria bacterium]|nr:dihydrofolate reductase [Candidatus Gracilibacteria bacterium]
MKDIIAIFAIDEEFGIGKNGDIPWKSDLKNFKEITLQTKDKNKQNALIMGRKTWESIPEKFRPFFGRQNYIISNTISINKENTLSFKKVEDAIDEALKDNNIENIFLIGGAGILKKGIEKNLITKLYLTFITGKYNCDTFIDLDLNNWLCYKQKYIEVGEEKYLFKCFKK